MNAPAPAAAITLDLAFDTAPELPAALLESAADAEAWRLHLENWLEQLQPDLPQTLRARCYSLGLQLIGDAEMAELNGTWRHREGPTDVLAFAAQEGAPPPPDAVGEGEEMPLELGDILISLETASRQAAAADQTLHRELLFLACHGLLHLLGWDHPDDTSLAAMLDLQEHLLTETTPGGSQPGERR